MDTRPTYALNHYCLVQTGIRFNGLVQTGILFNGQNQTGVRFIGFVVVFRVYMFVRFKVICCSFVNNFGHIFRLYWFFSNLRYWYFFSQWPPLFFSSKSREILFPPKCLYLNNKHTDPLISSAYILVRKVLKYFTTIWNPCYL